MALLSERAVFLGLVHALLFAGAASAAATPIQVCVPEWKEEILTTHIVAAQERGFFADAGLEADIRFLPYAQPGIDPYYISDANVARLTADGSSKCQFGSTTIDAVLLESLPGSALKPVQFYLYGLDYDTHLVVSNGSKIRSVADLKGKKVRLGPLLTRLAMRRMLKKSGLDMSDIKVVALKSGDVLEKLTSGEIDAAITYRPNMALLLASGKVTILEQNVIGRYVMPYAPHSMVVVNAEFARKNPQAVEKFSAALRKADAYLNENPAEFIRTLQRRRIFLWKGQPLDEPWIERSASLMGNTRIHEASDRIKDGERQVSILDSVEKFRKLLVEDWYLPDEPDRTHLAAWRAFGL
ncbi:MAG: ABC transporter substrate-binding protein [Elusimicrobia bacterium]|nr:ABC transporter substrate-binding protein [Elusimicrobiota bacterium]